MINRLKKEHHITSINVEKVFDKLQDPLKIKSLRKIGIKGDILYLIKGI